MRSPPGAARPRGPGSRGRPGVGVLEAALAISYDFPLALGLETAALVIGSAGAGTPEQRAALLLAAADLRERGDRPPPVSMPAPDVPAVPSERLDARAAARLARKLLADL